MASGKSVAAASMDALASTSRQMFHFVPWAGGGAMACARCSSTASHSVLRAIASTPGVGNPGCALACALAPCRDGRWRRRWREPGADRARHGWTGRRTRAPAATGAAAPWLERQGLRARPASRHESCAPVRPGKAASARHRALRHAPGHAGVLDGNRQRHGGMGGPAVMPRDTRIDGMRYGRATDAQNLLKQGRAGDRDMAEDVSNWRAPPDASALRRGLSQALPLWAG